MKDYESHLRPDWGVFPLSELAEKCAEKYGSNPIMKTWDGTEYKPISFIDFKAQVHAIARWLLSRGISEGDRVAILGENRREWAACYLAIQRAGAVAVPIDSMMPGPGIRHVLKDSGSRFLFTTDKFVSVVAELSRIKTLESMINMDNHAEENCLKLDEVLDEGRKLDTEFRKRSLDELAAILYTSGTTGLSKGVMLTQKNIASNVSTIYRLLDLQPGDTFLSVLPVHHSFEATAGFLFPLYCGCCIAYSRSLKSNDIISGIKDNNVTLMVGVPLLFEKMHDGMLRGIKKKGKKTERTFKTVFGLVKAGEKLGLDLGTPLFKSLREKAGFKTIRYFVSGGGPLDPYTSLFFKRLGLKILQGYGLTETSPVTHVNPPWDITLETVGPTISGVECQIIDKNDQGIGEICIKGPNVFKGYFNNEKATKDTFTDDGWFKTGDLGFKHDNGYLQITGRKKSMLVTGGGKNVYPEEIEFYLNRSRFIAESVVLGIPREKGLGDNVGALIHPDYEQIDLYYEEKESAPTEDDIYKLIKAEIKEAQKNLADYKRIKTFRIFEEEFQKTTKRTIKRFLYMGEMLKVNGEK